MNDRQIKALIKEGKTGRHAVGNGLYLRITTEGTPVWVVRYSINGKRREITLDSYSEMGLADAKAETTVIKREVRNRVDPLAEKKRLHNQKFDTVDQLAEDWLKDCDKRLKYPRIPRQVYRDYISPTIGALRLDRVTPLDIRAMVRKVVDDGKPSRANDTLGYCKQVFRHAMKLNLVKANPAEAFTIGDAGGIEKGRARALGEKELAKVFKTLRENQDQFVRENYLAFALLLCLGVRKGELVGALWSEFDLRKKLWNLPAERSKSGAAITIPLPPPAIEWLKELKVRAFSSEYVFPNRRKSKRFGHMSPDTLNAALKKMFLENKLKVPHFTVHDLRRTCRSLMAQLNIPSHVAERSLNHKLKGVEGIYDRYDYLDERRDALDKVAELVAPIINDL